jgi:hemerythrin
MNKDFEKFTQKSIDTLKKLHIDESRKRFFDEFLLTLKIFFKKEEAEYLKVGHPDHELHQKLHQEFIRTVVSFEYEYFLSKKGDNEKYMEAMDYFKEWFEFHHGIEDSAMMPFIRIHDFIESKRK